MGQECDFCGGAEYTPENPRVLYCQRRPSDRADMCCTMAGHWDCATGRKGTPYAPQLPTVGADYGGALATGDDLEKWIEGPDARALGYLFLT